MALGLPLLLSLIATQVQAVAIFDKRQAVSSSTCGGNNNSITICSPSSSSVWYNNTYQEIIWNYNNPVFNHQDTLTFYILQPASGSNSNSSNSSSSSSSSTSYQTIKSLNVNTALGAQVVLVDDSFYPSLLPDNSPNVTLHVSAYIVGAGVDPLTEIANPLTIYPLPVPFTMIQNSHNTSSTHSSNNGTSSAPQSTSGASSGNLAIPNWAIAVIVVAGVAIIAAALGSFWFLRRVRRHRQQRKLAADELVVRDTKHEPSSALSSPTSHPSSTHLVGTLKTAQSSSINSFTPILGGASGSLRGASPTTETSPPHQLKSVTSAATAKKDGVLSSNDAMMLADTFRKHLRKPEWTDDSESALLEEKK